MGTHQKKVDIADKLIQRFTATFPTSYCPPSIPDGPFLNRNLNCFLRKHLPPVSDPPPESIVCYYSFECSNGNVYASPGYTCWFCDGLPFPSLTYLHFHLIHVHPKTKYTVHGPMTDEATGAMGVSIAMDPKLDFSSTPEESEFCWIKPRRRPDVHALLRGDGAWYNDSGSSPSSSPEPIDTGLSDLSSISAALPLPPRINGPRVPVPHPTNGLPGPIYLRSRSKRFISYDEVLSDSEDDSDVDQSIFLRERTHETIDEYADLTSAEKRFAKMWNDHLLVDPCQARCYMPQILLRFAEMNTEVLRPRDGEKGREMWEVYSKHCLLLVQQRVIDAAVLKAALETAKGAGEM